MQQRLQLSADAFRITRVQLGVFFEQAYDIECGERGKTDELHPARAGDRVGNLVVQKAREKIWSLLWSSQRKEAALLQLLSEQADKELKDVAVAIVKGMIVLDHHCSAQAGAVYRDCSSHGVELEDVVIACKGARRSGELLI